MSGRPRPTWRRALVWPALVALMLAPGAGARSMGAPAPGEKVLAGLSQNQVAITTAFSGSEIFIYGAVKREAPPPSDKPLNVIVTVIGPSQEVIVRRKEHVFGIWVNGEGVRVDAAPSFYAVATTGPFRKIISWTDDMRYHVGLDQLVRLIGTPRDIEYPEAYRQAVIRLRQEKGLYIELPGKVKLTQQTLFETRILLPANLVEGDYRARIFLLRDRKVIDVFNDSILVRKEGLERWIYNMAHQRAALYGLGSILLAFAAGWTASTVFRVLRR